MGSFVYSFLGCALLTCHCLLFFLHAFLLVCVFVCFFLFVCFSFVCCLLVFLSTGCMLAVCLSCPHQYVPYRIIPFLVFAYATHITVCVYSFCCLQVEGHNSGCAQRLLRLEDLAVDPLEPPRFKHKRVPAARFSPPPPVLHSPTSTKSNCALGDLFFTYF